MKARKHPRELLYFVYLEKKYATLVLSLKVYKYLKLKSASGWALGCKCQCLLLAFFFCLNTLDHSYLIEHSMVMEMYIVKFGSH